MTQIGRIPSVGNHFEWSGIHFEIVDMDNNRIDKMLVIRSAKDIKKDVPKDIKTAYNVAYTQSFATLYDCSKVKIIMFGDTRRK